MFYSVYFANCDLHCENQILFISVSQITVRPNSSPYKKPVPSLTGTPTSRINSTHPPPYTAEEIQRLAPSHSTEELNQEMANLEGLMKDLNAITASEFEC